MSPLVRTLFFGNYALVVEQWMNVSCYVSILIFPFDYEKKICYLKDVCGAMHSLPHQVLMLLEFYGVFVCLGVRF